MFIQIIIEIFSAIVFNITCKSLSYVCEKLIKFISNMLFFCMCHTIFYNDCWRFFLYFSLWQNIINSFPGIPYVILEKFKTQLKIYLFSCTNTCL